MKTKAAVDLINAKYSENFIMGTLSGPGEVKPQSFQFFNFVSLNSFLSVTTTVTLGQIIKTCVEKNSLKFEKVA